MESAGASARCEDDFVWPPLGCCWWLPRPRKVAELLYIRFCCCEIIADAIQMHEMRRDTLLLLLLIPLLAAAQPPTPEAALQVSFGEAISPNATQQLACRLAGVSPYFTVHFVGVDLEAFPDACGRYGSGSLAALHQHACAYGPPKSKKHQPWQRTLSLQVRNPVLCKSEQLCCRRCSQCDSSRGRSVPWVWRQRHSRELLHGEGVGSAGT